MSHDVFVSYSAKDKAAADAVVAGLEGDGLRCWMAPRDILAGTVWGEAIVEAIGSSRVMVLVLSGHSNRSRQVLREVEQAVTHEVIILPFRIEAIDPSGAMSYYLSTEHWLDALTPPMERHIDRLNSSIQALFSGEPMPRQEAVDIPADGRRKPLLIGGVVAAVLVGAAALFALGSGGGGDEVAAPTTAVPSTATPSSDVSAPGETQTSAVIESVTTTAVLPTVTIPPPMFAVPSGALVDITQAAGRWRLDHDVTEAELEANSAAIAAMATESQSAWATTVDDGGAGEELARLAPLTFCQLMEEPVPPDNIVASIAATAGEVDGDGTADYSFASWVGAVATLLVCPEEEPSWNLATGGLGEGLLLSENFDDGAPPGWLTGSHEAGNITVEGGAMRLEPNSIGYILSTLSPQSFSDVVIDVWVQAVGFNRDAGYGVTCREGPDQSYGTFYMFDVNGEGVYELWFYEPDGTANHLEGTYSSAINPPPETNHLTVFCGDETMALLINGKLVGFQSHSALGNGKISLIAFSGEHQGVDVRFDNLIVRAPSPDAYTLLDAVRIPRSS